MFWWASLIFTGIGLIGVCDRLFYGHLHAHYGNIVPWGLWIAAYIYFIGLSAGAFLISSLVYVFGFKQYEKIGRVALFTAVVTLLMALGSVVADIGHMDRAWHILVYPNIKSPMAWIIWLYGAYFILLSCELWLVLRRDLVLGRGSPGMKGKLYGCLTRFGSQETSGESGKRDLARIKVLASFGIPLAIMFHGGVGALFGVIAARPHWHSGLFPILFLLSALASGGAILIVVAAVFQDGWNKNRETLLSLGKLVLGLMLLDVIFQFSEILVAFRGGIPGQTEGMYLVMFGPYWYIFWLWQIALGTVVPVFLLVFSKSKNDVRWVTLAGLLIAAGFFGLRLNIVIPGLTTEEIAGIAHAIASARYGADYFPSISEFLLSIGVLGMGLLLFGIGEKYLPNENEGSHNVHV